MKAEEPVAVESRAEEPLTEEVKAVEPEDEKDEIEIDLSGLKKIFGRSKEEVREEKEEKKASQELKAEKAQAKADSKIVATEKEVIELSNQGYDCQPIGENKWLMRRGPNATFKVFIFQKSMCNWRFCERNSMATRINSVC